MNFRSRAIAILPLSSGVVGQDGERLIATEAADAFLGPKRVVGDLRDPAQSARGPGARSSLIFRVTLYFAHEKRRTRKTAARCDFGADDTGAGWAWLG